MGAEQFTVAVVGLGHAGLPLSLVIADAGIKVIGVDINKERVEMINAGTNPLPEEPGLEELLKKNLGKTFRAVTSVDEAAQECNTYIVIVPLLVDDEMRPNFKYLNDAFNNISKVLKQGDLVVLETTVPVGTTRGLVRHILERSGLVAGKDFYLGYSPERMMTGYAISRYKEFPKLIAGIDDASLEKMHKLYSQFCANIVSAASCEEAELAKIFEGIYRDVNIALANEMMKIAESYGLNFWRVRKLAKHAYCNIMRAGIGVGGHCIPVYPWFVINSKAGSVAKLTLVARQVNDSMVDFFLQKIRETLKKEGKILPEAKVAVLGVTYRPGTKYVAFSRALVLIKRLKENNVVVSALDPMLSPEELEKLTHCKEAKLEEQDLIVVTNRYEEFKEQLKALEGKIPIIDCANLLGENNEEE